MLVCVCVCARALYYLRGLTAFNVLAALVMGGLGVSESEPACGLPYPTPGPLVCRAVLFTRAKADYNLLFTRDIHV